MDQAVILQSQQQIPQLAQKNIKNKTDKIQNQIIITDMQRSELAQTHPYFWKPIIHKIFEDNKKLNFEDGVTQITRTEPQTDHLQTPKQITKIDRPEYNPVNHNEVTEDIIWHMANQIYKENQTSPQTPLQDQGLIQQIQELAQIHRMKELFMEEQIVYSRDHLASSLTDHYPSQPPGMIIHHQPQDIQYQNQTRDETEEEEVEEENDNNCEKMKKLREEKRLNMLRDTISNLNLTENSLHKRLLKVRQTVHNLESTYTDQMEKQQEYENKYYENYHNLQNYIYLFPFSFFAPFN